MIYPFTHLVIGKFDPLPKYEFYESDKEAITAGWTLTPIKCPEVSAWVDSFEDMVAEQISLSVSIGMDWHIDTNNYGIVTHRILIPISDNFIWQWQLKDGTIETCHPVIGNIYLFNNMILHRVVADEKRATICFNMYDKKIENELPLFKTY
jgi:hypothetical protein